MNKLNHLDNLRSQDMLIQKRMEEQMEFHHVMQRAFGVRTPDKLKGGGFVDQAR